MIMVLGACKMITPSTRQVTADLADGARIRRRGVVMRFGVQLDQLAQACRRRITCGADEPPRSTLAAYGLRGHGGASPQRPDGPRCAQDCR
jgi:hypothetical protein